jgi:hypothetical protein
MTLDQVFLRNKMDGNLNIFSLMTYTKYDNTKLQLIATPESFILLLIPYGKKTDNKKRIVLESLNVWNRKWKDQ